MSAATFAAVDLGASSGRVMVGRVGPNELALQQIHRFPNDPVQLPDGLHWDILRLYHQVLVGLRQAGRFTGDLVSVGIDSWAVDYGLLDEADRLLGNPFHYRDGRTNAAVAAVHAAIPHQRLYERTGLQFLPFNTIYQLAAERGSVELAAARALLMIPDLIGFWLSGVHAIEVTNASTTGLLDVREQTWASDLLDGLGLPRRLFTMPQGPGTTLGPLRSEVLTETGLPVSTTLTLVGSHDTASAVVAVPAQGDRFAYIACGTWSLVGVELDAPVLTEASRAANFTNEFGVDGRVRYLRNVMGLWLLQESLRAWERVGSPSELTPLLEAAAGLRSGGPIIDPDDPVFLPPGDMPSRIVDACRRTGQREPASKSEMLRCILDSLATAYARALRDAVLLSGRDVDVVHLVGGGSLNDLLCQLTADICELPVVAGPVEATALGNVLVQARAHGAVQGDLEGLRALVRSTQTTRRYEPRRTPIASAIEASA